MTGDEITQGKKNALIEAYKICASVTVAARLAKVSRKTHYVWMNEDPEYEAAFLAAKPIAAQALEDEAVRRAHKGTIKPVFYKGVRCGGIREYSDTLLIFLLNGAMPNKYKQRSEITGADGGPIKVVVEGMLGAEWLRKE